MAKTQLVSLTLNYDAVDGSDASNSYPATAKQVIYDKKNPKHFVIGNPSLKVGDEAYFALFKHSKLVVSEIMTDDPAVRVTGVGDGKYFNEFESVEFDDLDDSGENKAALPIVANLGFDPASINWGNDSALQGISVQEDQKTLITSQGGFKSGYVSYFNAYTLYKVSPISKTYPEYQSEGTYEYKGRLRIKIKLKVSGS